MISLTRQFAAWCRSKPADETYDYLDSRNCAFAQFLKEQGVAADPLVWDSGWRDGVGGNLEVIPKDLVGPLRRGPDTFGALADRVERQIDELGGMGASLRDRVLAVPAEPAAQSHRFALRPTGAGER